MNVGTFNTNPRENIIPPWLLACSCAHQRCHCNAIFKPYILCVKGHPHNNNIPPSNPSNNITIQFVELTYCNNRFSQ